jgi:hypothetical protein
MPTVCPHHSHCRCGFAVSHTECVSSTIQPGLPFRDRPAMMESVDCWPLATTLIQTLEGKPFPVTVLLDVIDLWYPSAFTVYVTASKHVSDVRLLSRDGPQVERFQTRQLDVTRRFPPPWWRDSEGIPPTHDWSNGLRGQSCQLPP